MAIGRPAIDQATTDRAAEVLHAVTADIETIERITGPDAQAVGVPIALFSAAHRQAQAIRQALAILDGGEA